MSSLQTFFGSANSTVARQRESPIDMVIYVASLASNPREIDPILDDLRMVTSTLEPGDVPTAEDNARLSKVYFKIEDYLIHEESLRAYTKESLQKKIADKFEVVGGSIEAYWKQAGTHAKQAHVAKQPSAETTEQVNRTHRFSKVFIIASIVVGFMSLFFPAVPSPEAPFSNHINMGLSLAAALLLFGASLQLIRGFSSITTRLKVVYGLLCAAMVLLALAQSQQVIYTEFDLWGIDFLQQGGVALGYLPATLLFYISMYKFARLLKVRSWANSIIVLLISCVVIAGLAVVLPIPSPLPPEVLRIALPPSLLLATIIAFAALIVLAIKKVASVAYTNALAWLFVGLAGTSLIALLYAMIQIFFPGGNLFLSYGGISLLFGGVGLAMVRSAVAFNLINED